MFLFEDTVHNIKSYLEVFAMKELDYKVFRKEVDLLLSDVINISIATSYNDNVTVRTVFFICKDLNFYFLTRKSSTKYKQMLKNDKVALCVKNVQIEGVAKLLGHPENEENDAIRNFCVEHGYDDFSRYMKLKNMRLVEVKPSLITVWKKGSRAFLDVANVKAYKIGRG